MKEFSKNVDIAVVFKKKNVKELIIFEPKFISIGRLNKETMEFLDLEDQIKYQHIAIDSNSPYGYALRMKLSDLIGIYGTNNIKLLFKLYLKELKERRYFFTIDTTSNIRNLSLVSQDKKYNSLFIEKDKDLDEILKKSDPFLDINKLISNIKSNVIGQDDAIEEIVSILWKNSRKENKSNILLIGPTGVGKTEILRQIAKYLNIPLTIIDVSNLTKTGYKGDSVDDILKKVLINCDSNILKAENSIIVLDEFDKLASKEQGDTGISSVGVQQELLKLMEDGEYTVELGDEIFASNKINIKTSGITFIVAGAFSKLFEEEIISNPIGFGSKSNNSQKINNKKKITNEDIIEYGIISEALGRLHNIVILNSLTEENLINIMKNPNNYMLNESINIFNELGIKVKINENVYKIIAQNAIAKKIGARGLIGSIDTLFSKASLDAKRNAEINGYNYLEINEETVKDNSKYVLKRVKTKEKEQDERIKRD